MRARRTMSTESRARKREKTTNTVRKITPLERKASSTTMRTSKTTVMTTTMTRKASAREVTTMTMRTRAQTNAKSDYKQQTAAVLSPLPLEIIFIGKVNITSRGGDI